MHPLVPNLSQLSDEELHRKRSELNTRLIFASRLGHTGVYNQLQMLIYEYQTEIETRNRKMLEELQKNNPQFKDLIDIK
jgi:hypothetical protein